MEWEGHIRWWSPEAAKTKSLGIFPHRMAALRKSLFYLVLTCVSGFRTEEMVFEIIFPCLTSSRYLCPRLVTAVGSLAFHNAWDHRATPWMAQATIKLSKLKRSAVGRLLSQGRLTYLHLVKLVLDQMYSGRGTEQWAWMHGGFNLRMRACIPDAMFCCCLQKQNSDL